MPPTIQVANIGMADSLILMVLALVVFGPRRLPEIGRQIGKLMYEFRKASNDFKFQMEEELRNAEEADRRKKEEEERQRQLAANPPAQIEASVTESATETSSSYDANTTYGSTYDEVAEAQAQAAAETPRILPPSTGEPVATEKPGASAAASEATAEPEAVTAAAADAIAAEAHAETAAEDTHQSTEPAHNG